MSACVTYIACITQVTLEVINYTLFIYDRWLCFFHIQFLFNFRAGKSNLNDCVFFFWGGGVYFNSHKMANIDEFPYGVLGPHASSNSEKKLNSFGSCVYVLQTTGFKEKRAARAKFVVFHFTYWARFDWCSHCRRTHRRLRRWSQDLSMFLNG